MKPFRVQERAGRRLDEIFRYTSETWGEAQAERYMHGLFERFQAIADEHVPWRPIPADFDVDGYYSRDERHVVYWKMLPDRVVGIVAVLHVRMHQMERFR